MASVKKTFHAQKKKIHDPIWQGTKHIMRTIAGVGCNLVISYVLGESSRSRVVRWRLLCRHFQEETKINIRVHFLLMKQPPQWPVNLTKHFYDARYRSHYQEKFEEAINIFGKEKKRSFNRQKQAVSRSTNIVFVRPQDFWKGGAIASLNWFVRRRLPRCRSNVKSSYPVTKYGDWKHFSLCPLVERAAAGA